MSYESILLDISNHVATITLNRPEVLNCFDSVMCAEFRHLWQALRDDDDVHCMVLRASGDRAFSAGADQREPPKDRGNVWNHPDEGDALGPKRNRVWKPLVCAVQGMCVGGAFYWINEADIILCSEEATFFDPHVTYGRTSALEAIGLRYRMPLGELLRVVLLGLNERMSATRALEIGLVSEVVARESLWSRAAELAGIIAQRPPVAVQGSVKAIWESLDLPRSQAINMGTYYPMVSKASQDPLDMNAVSRPAWTVR